MASRVVWSVVVSSEASASRPYFRMSLTVSGFRALTCERIPGLRPAMIAMRRSSPVTFARKAFLSIVVMNVSTDSLGPCCNPQRLLTSLHRPTLSLLNCTIKASRTFAYVSLLFGVRFWNHNFAESLSSSTTAPSRSSATSFLKVHHSSKSSIKFSTDCSESRPW